MWIVGVILIILVVFFCNFCEKIQAFHSDKKDIILFREISLFSTYIFLHRL